MAIIGCHIALYVILTLIKIVVDAGERLRNSTSLKVEVITILDCGKTLLVKNNQYMIYDALVSVYFWKMGYEIYLGQAYVKHIQDEFMQIGIIEFDTSFEERHPEAMNALLQDDNSLARKLLIRNVVKFKN